MSAIQLSINGSPHDLDVSPETPLLWVSAGQTQYDGHEVRLRHGSLRRLHGSP